MNNALIGLIFIGLFFSMLLVRTYCKKKSLKIGLAVVISLFAVYMAVFSVDFNRTASLSAPIFAMENNIAGNRVSYVGLGYSIELEKDTITRSITRSQMTMLGMFITRAVA